MHALHLVKQRRLLVERRLGGLHLQVDKVHLVAPRERRRRRQPRHARHRRQARALRQHAHAQAARLRAAAVDRALRRRELRIDARRVGGVGGVRDEVDLVQREVDGRPGARTTTRTTTEAAAEATAEATSGTGAGGGGATAEVELGLRELLVDIGGAEGRLLRRLLQSLLELELGAEIDGRDAQLVLRVTRRGGRVALLERVAVGGGASGGATAAATADDAGQRVELHEQRLRVGGGGGVLLAQKLRQLAQALQPGTTTTTDAAKADAGGRLLLQRRRLSVLALAAWGQRLVRGRRQRGVARAQVDDRGVGRGDDARQLVQQHHRHRLGVVVVATGGARGARSAARSSARRPARHIGSELRSTDDAGKVFEETQRDALLLGLVLVLPNAVHRDDQLLGLLHRGCRPDNGRRHGRTGRRHGEGVVGGAAEVDGDDARHLVEQPQRHLLLALLLAGAGETSGRRSGDGGCGRRGGVEPREPRRRRGRRDLDGEHRREGLETVEVVEHREQRLLALLGRVVVVDSGTRRVVGRQDLYDARQLVERPQRLGLCIGLVDGSSRRGSSRGTCRQPYRRRP